MDVTEESAAPAPPEPAPTPAPPAEPAPDVPPAPAHTPPPTRKEILKIAAQLIAGIVGLLGIVALVAYLFREQLEALSAGFVSRFGYVGMGIGTFLADAFHLPIPPQFYMVAAISGEQSQVLAMTAISIGSLIGGTTAFWLSTKLARVKWIERFLARSRGKVDGLFRRYGYWAVAVGSITPIPFSTLCYAAGLYRMPFRVFAFLALFRVPRLIVIYYIVKVGLRVVE